MSYQDDAVSKRCRDNMVPCQDGTMTKRHHVTRSSCQHDVVSRRHSTKKRCRIIKNDVASACRCAIKKSCHHGVVSIRSRGNAASYQYDTVSTRRRVACYVFSKRCRFKSMSCQCCIVSRRHHVKTVPCQHGAVSRRCRARNDVV